jgi:superfamily II DNA/RNA helicase
MDKVEMLSRMLQAKDRGLTIIFSRTKRTAAKVADELTERGFAAAAIHGDLGQGAREQALRAFRHGKVDILVATDVAARGIDVEHVTHVINFQCPEDEKTYLHRIGRTARAGNTGIAVTFVDWDDLHRWALINKALDLGIPEPQETYSSSEHLYSDLDIPAGVKGYLRKSQQTREGLAAEVLEDLGETGKSAGRGRGHREHAEGKGARERPAPAADSAPAESRPRRSRNRRRTRGAGAAVAGAGVGHDGESSGAAADGGGQSAGTDAPRRRRRRGGSSRADASAAAE